MTKLADALRGVVDRAPMDGIEVSSAAAARKVRRQRTVRGTANGLLGAGAVAVIAFAAVGPGSLGAASPGEKVGAQSDLPPQPSAGIATDGSYDSRLAFGFCGGTLDEPVFYADAPATMQVRGLGDAADGGSTQSVTVTLTATNDFAGSTAGPELYVLWNGMIVGRAVNESGDLTDVAFVSGDAVEGTQDLVLVNCWDGAALPGGSYQVVASQEFFTATSDEPGIESPGTGEDVIAPETTVTTESTIAPNGGVAPDNIVGYDAGFRVVSEPIELTVSGDVPEDPFGQYLPAPIEPVALPSDYLTPDLARELFAAHQTSAAWNMAPGTQRVVRTGDSAEEQVGKDLWTSNYFGCSYDGSTGRSFPTQSADFPLLDVTGSIPSALNVSYGWIVDGNPSVSLNVTNVSGYSLPTMVEPGNTLMLVKDGVVVAEAYLTSINRDAYATPITAENSFLKPGGSVSGTYVWRDVNGCWAGNSQPDVKPGKYTVLSIQDVYLSNEGPYLYPGDGGGVMYDTASGAAERSVAGDAKEVAPEPALISAPNPGNYEYVQLQVWTSLGTVTVTD